MNIILDVDGTLWNTTEIVAEAWNRAVDSVGLYDELGHFVTAKLLQQEFGKPMDIIIDDLFPGQPDEKKSEILDAVKVHESAAIKSCTNSLAYPDVIPTISKLNSLGHKLYIVSNCQEGYIPLVMNILNIEEYITDYECFGVTGLSKSENIELVLDRNKIPPHTSCYVGDTEGDYLSAVAAGIPFIHAAYGFGTMPKDYNGQSISSFSELLNIIQ